MEAQECGTLRCTLHSFIVPYTSVCLHLQQRSSLTDCIVDIIRQSSCTQYDIISMATSWGAGREVHSGSSSLTSTADVMEEQHQTQADSSHQHCIRPHHVPSCKDCASEVLHHDSTWNELQENYGDTVTEEIRFRPMPQWIVSMHRMHSRVVGEFTRSRALSGSFVHRNLLVCAQRTEQQTSPFCLLKYARMRTTASFCRIVCSPS